MRPIEKMCTFPNNFICVLNNLVRFNPDFLSDTKTVYLIL